MRGLIVLCFCATVLAAPQGYIYNQQQNGLSIGLPNYSSSSQAVTATETQENRGFVQQAINPGSLPQTLFSGHTNTHHNSQQFSAVPSFSNLQQHAAFTGNFGGQQNSLIDNFVGEQQQQQNPAAANFGGQQQHQNSLIDNFVGEQQQQQNPAAANFGGQQQHQNSLIGNFVGEQQHQQQSSAAANFDGQQHQQQSHLLGNFGGQQQLFNGMQPQQQQYQGPGTVTKDIYVHVAPDDGHDQQYQQRQQVPQAPRKHYRIVFIKAPSQSVNNAALRLQQAPTEEKTIIYVLTKKADPLDLQNAIQDIQPKQPSKPEVYFIKYKTQAEAQHAQRTIQAQYDKLGGTSQISDEGIAPVTSVVGSLDNPQQLASLDFSTGSSQSSSSSSATSSSHSRLNSKTATANGSKYLPPLGKL